MKARVVARDARAHQRCPRGELDRRGAGRRRWRPELSVRRRPGGQRVGIQYACILASRDERARAAIAPPSQGHLLAKRAEIVLEVARGPRDLWSDEAARSI